MPASVDARVELSVDDLVTAVLQLTPRELSEFELRLEELQIARTRFGDQEAARIAGAHRLPEAERYRVRDLLDRNRQGHITAPETAELDQLMAEMERRLDAVADEILAIADRRRRDSGHAENG